MIRRGEPGSIAPARGPADPSTGDCSRKTDDGEEEELRQDRERQIDHCELVEQLADKAEAGYDVDETLRRRGGRPPIGSAAASVESVRLDPELHQALAQRAERDHETTSSVIRKALRKYLQVG